MTPPAAGYTVLVVYSSRTGQNRRLCEAFLEGTHTEGIEGVTTRMVAAPDAGAADVLAADLVVLAASPNIGMINGALKDFCERIYYPCIGHTHKLPCALVCKGDTDATGALRDTERILRGLTWRQVAEPLVVLGDVSDVDLDAARELGATLAGGLSLGLW